MFVRFSFMTNSRVIRDAAYTHMSSTTVHLPGIFQINRENRPMLEIATSVRVHPYMICGADL